MNSHKMTPEENKLSKEIFGNMASLVQELQEYNREIGDLFKTSQSLYEKSKVIDKKLRDNFFGCIKYNQRKVSMFCADVTLTIEDLIKDVSFYYLHQVALHCNLSDKELLEDIGKLVDHL